VSGASTVAPEPRNHDIDFRFSVDQSGTRRHVSLMALVNANDLSATLACAAVLELIEICSDCHGTWRIKKSHSSQPNIDKNKACIVQVYIIQCVSNLRETSPMRAHDFAGPGKRHFALPQILQKCGRHNIEFSNMLIA
jgi:hypothetical protein